MGKETTPPSLAGSCGDDSHLDYPADSSAVLGTKPDDPELTTLNDFVTDVDGVRTLERSDQKFLVSRLTVANSFEFLAHAQNHDFDKLKREAKAMIEEHFETLALSPAFLQCPHALVDKLLASPDLVVRSEMQVFNAVVRWVACTPDENENGANNEGKKLSRKERAERLLRHVDLERLSEAQLKAVVRHTMTRSCPKFFDSALEHILYCTPDMVDDSLLAYAIKQLKAVLRHKITRLCPKFCYSLLERVLCWMLDERDDSLLSSGCHLKARKRCNRDYTFTFEQRGMKMYNRTDEKEIVALAERVRNAFQPVKPSAHDDKQVLLILSTHDDLKELLADLAELKSNKQDNKEVVFTPWAHDDTRRIMWRLVIYPRGYDRAKGQFLSVFLQARSAVDNEKLDLNARFDIFVINRKDGAATVSFSSKHHFREHSVDWGFPNFLPVGEMLDAGAGFIDVESDSLLVGANIYYLGAEKALDRYDNYGTFV